MSIGHFGKMKPQDSGRQTGRAKGKMQDNKNTEALEKELQERLDWYIAHAYGDEYDEKAVEYILYLLDSVAPLEEGVIPPRGEAWEDFRKAAEEQRELLPLEEMPAPVPQSPKKKAGKISGFAARHKMIAAAVLVLLILAVGGSIQAGARKGTGFFFWMKSDESGMQRMTSPQNMDSRVEVNLDFYYSEDDVPEWAQEWAKKEVEFEMPDNYKWQRFEINEFESFRRIRSCYWNEDINTEVFLGVTIHHEKVTYYEDVYLGYNFVERYEIDERQTYVYNKTEESGTVNYVICIFADKYMYSIENQNDLENAKILMEQYWEWMKK